MFKSFWSCPKYTFIYHTLKCTFEVRRKLAVNFEVETNWVSIKRKRQSSCQLKERVNQPSLFTHTKPVSQMKKRKGYGEECWINIVFFFRKRGWVNFPGRLIHFFLQIDSQFTSFFKHKWYSPLFPSLQPICLFLQMYFYVSIINMNEIDLNLIASYFCLAEGNYNNVLALLIFYVWINISFLILD